MVAMLVPRVAPGYQRVDERPGNGGGVQNDREYTDRTRDVLYLPLADIDKRDVEIAMHLVTHDAGDADAARSRQSPQVVPQR